MRHVQLRVAQKIITTTHAFSDSFSHVEILDSLDFVIYGSNQRGKAELIETFYCTVPLHGSIARS